jgi:hypothetical protein
MSFATEAALARLMHFAPQRSALSELQRAAEETYRNSVQAGRSAGILGQQSVREAMPQEREIYNRAEKQSERAHNLLAPVLSGLQGTRGQGFATAAANERAASEEALARNRANAMTNLHQQLLSQAAAPGYTARAAGQNLIAELAKIFSKSNSLGAQEGAFTTGQEEKLRAAYNKEQAKTAAEAKKEAGVNARFYAGLRQKEASSRLAHPGGAAAVKPQSQAEESKASNAIQTMLQRLERSGVPRRESERARLIQGLTTEIPEHTREVGSEKVKVGKIVGYPVGPQMNAAIDQWIYGYVNPVHEQHLKEQGYNVKALGLTRYEERPQPPQTPASGVYGESKPGR